MEPHVDAHKDLHSEQGALRGEHPGRSRNPLIKVRDLAWLEFEKPDLVRAEAFARAFGFTTVLHTADELYLRGTDAGSTCVIVRRGTHSRFVGPAFAAQDKADVERLASATGRTTRTLPEAIGGVAVELTDPSGIPVRVVAGMHELAELAAQQPHTFNFGHELRRTNATQRPPREPARVQRLGHVVLQSTKYLQTLDWYLDHLGLIVSDFLYYPGQRDRGPAMSFIRCDRGSTPADHHTLALALGPSNRYVHSAYQTCDLDAIAAGGEYLRELGYHRSWGIGRHIQGSQIFDYWRDPDGFLVEHFADGDMFDNTLEPGWAPFTASGLAQWGPPATKDFLGIAPEQGSSSRAAVDADRDPRRQRIRPHPPARTYESGTVMSISIYRTSDAWWAGTADAVAKVDTAATTTAQLLADRAAIERAAASTETVAVKSLDLLAPVTAPCRVVAQMTNFASHVEDTGGDPKTVPLTFFRKASGSITGPVDDIVKPEHVRLLDYEVEIGLVIGRDVPVGTTITADNLADYVCGLVVTNDVSARDVQLTKTQFYESKSYPTFTPVGPALVLLDAEELNRFGELRLQLRVNGELRQDSTVESDMIYRPVQALAALARFQQLSAGDLVMTGTPVGTALSAPPKPVQKLVGLLPDDLKWKMFFSGQAKNTKYLHDGDVVEASIATDDGKIDLGTQRNRVRYA